MTYLEHAFTHAGCTYDCIARVIPFIDGPRKERRVWRVLVNQREYRCMMWSGDEFRSPEARARFEEAIVRLIADGNAQPS